MDAMMRAQKPIIGHSLLIDLMYMYDTFVQDLPLDWVACERELFRISSSFFDTKYVACTAAFHGMLDGTSLEAVVATTCQPPFVTPLIRTFPAEWSMTYIWQMFQWHVELALSTMMLHTTLIRRVSLSYVWWTTSVWLIMFDVWTTFRCWKRQCGELGMFDGVCEPTSHWKIESYEVCAPSTFQYEQ